MHFDIYKTNNDFEENCECAFSIYKFIDSINSNVRWFFDKCYVLDNHKKYSVILKSYDTPDYKDYLATVEATYNVKTQNYDIKLTSIYEPSSRGSE